jgi:hypothetical protein
MARTLATVLIGLFLVGCGKHYWEAPGRGVYAFSLDSTHCIKEATGSTASPPKASIARV